jgi:predicted phosphodiesterase
MLKPPDLTVGVISDTHLPYRMISLPPIIFNVFKGVDVILHAGDVDEIDLLTPLKKIAPLYAVRGNIHLIDFSSGGRDLPSQLELTLARYKVVVTHGHRPGLMGWFMKIPEFFLADVLWTKGYTFNDEIANRLCKLYPEADIIIFGHTHVPYSRQIGKTLCFNPGCVVPDKHKLTSVGLLRLWSHKIETHVIPLDQTGKEEARLINWVYPH